MDKHTKTQITPVRRKREYLDRWINDTQLGYRVAYWVGRRIGGKRLHALISPTEALPWVPFTRPLAEATVALIGTGGFHMCTDTPFRLESDASFRMISGSAEASALCITHEHYDRRDAARDLNLIFPLERLRELERERVIGRLAEEHYGFGFTKQPEDYAVPAHEIGRRMKRAGVHLALLVPA